jgi:hypothetical protein
VGTSESKDTESTEDKKRGALLLKPSQEPIWHILTKKRWILARFQKPIPSMNLKLTKKVLFLKATSKTTPTYSSSVLSVSSVVNSSNLFPPAIQLGTEFALHLSQ